MSIDKTPRSLAPQDAKLLESLHPKLRNILDHELNAGNEIREISAGWPKPTSILVILKYAFKAASTSSTDGLVYKELNDPHYWFAEFLHEGTNQIVACSFPR